MRDTLTGPGFGYLSAEATALLTPELADALMAVVDAEISVDDVPKSTMHFLHSASDDQGEGA